MRYLIGTREGLFLHDGSGTPAASGDLSGRSILAFRATGARLLAGTDAGLFRSDDVGRSWRPGGIAGREVWDIAVAPSDARVIYVGTQPAALYRSRDRGDSWSEIDALGKTPGAEHWGLPNSSAGARARTIVLDPEAPARCRVGLEVGGVLASEDDGASWTCILPGGNPDIHVMAGDPGRPGVLYATTGFGRMDSREPMERRIAGLFGSADRGRTWRYLWADREPKYTRPMSIDPRPPHALTVACAPNAFVSFRDPGGARSMLYQSTDGAHTWRSLGDAEHSPSPANILAVVPAPDTPGAVLVGTDVGEVWQVSPDARWTLVTRGLPMVQALLPLPDLR